eukprot:CAMPEP_0204265412 /NCGR_PEP_ID=MMETSP0468-20130131/9658_2 /ASSEMBLY_ACC=CAM_ASM_000383 /TAXON_ID=2969 /ORGANISM="Oxyrrhis marina" /LENGTH=36 /DNA_ID= /DNA_START= /DNA_END= /DNA_ORIENTATION=
MATVSSTLENTWAMFRLSLSKKAACWKVGGITAIAK